MSPALQPLMTVGEARRILRRPRFASDRSIQARDLLRLQQCGKPNHATVETHTGTTILGGKIMFWRRGRGPWMLDDGTCGTTSPLFSVTVRVGPLRKIHVVLTIAHLNHVAGDDRDENLKALCQWCHLNYDKLHHRDTRAERKDRARPLLLRVCA